MIKGFNPELFIDAQPPTKYKCPPLALGDLVSVARWDATEPPYKRIGDPCVVVGVSGGACESQRVIIKTPKGDNRILDRNWLAPYIDFA